MSLKPIPAAVFVNLSQLCVISKWHSTGLPLVRGNSRSGESQGISEFVREILNFVDSLGNF